MTGLIVEPTAAPESRNVSNSEVTTFLACKRQYDFAFILNLAPKVTPTPLARGTLGHLAFEYYVKARLAGDTHEQALKAAEEAYTQALREGVSLEVVMETKFLWLRYMNFHQGWPEYDLLGSEERMDLKLTDTLSMPIRYDLYVRNRKTGEYLIGDYKFTYDFWQPWEHDLNGQMPKYIEVMRLNGYPCDGGFLEEVRTRPLGKDKARDPKQTWRRTTYRPTIAVKRSVLRQHVATSLEIEKHRALSAEERETVSIPVLNKHGACKFCNFKDLCNSMNQGKKDLSVDIEVGYTQNTYGYNKQVMEVDLL